MWWHPAACSHLLPRFSVFTLGFRETRLPVHLVQELNTTPAISRADALDERQDRRDRNLSVGRQEAAAPMIDVIDPGVRFRIHLQAPARNQVEAQGQVVDERLKVSTENVGRLARLHDDIDADRPALRWPNRVELRALLRNADRPIGSRRPCRGSATQIRDDGIRECRRGDGALVADDITGERLPFLQRHDQRLLDRLGSLELIQVAQHHHRGEDHRGRIDHVLTGVLGCGTVDGFEDGDLVAVVSGRSEAESTDQPGGEIRNDVAVQIRRHDHIELFWCLDKLVGTVVDDEMVRLDVGILACDVLEDVLEPALGQLQDIGLGRTGDFAPTLRAGKFEGEVKLMPITNSEGNNSGGFYNGGNQQQRSERPEDYVQIDIGEIPEGVLRGTPLSANVIIKRIENAIVIPPSALRTIGARTYVQVVDPDGSKREVDVAVGMQTATLVEILEGLEPGQKVVGR